jgi:alpha-1,2-mannosyltransferase
VAASASVGVAGLAISISLFGVQNHLDYLRALSFMSQHGESYDANQSVNGLLNRLVHNGKNDEWDANSFAPYHPQVHFGTLASSLIILSLAFFWPQNRREKASELDFCLMALAGTMASPIAWEHHYGVLLPIYALLLPRLLAESNRRTLLLWLTLSYFLTSHHVIAANRLAETPFNFVQSYLWFGAVMALGILFRLRGVAAAEVQSAPVCAPGELRNQPLAA